MCDMWWINDQFVANLYYMYNIIGKITVFNTNLVVGTLDKMYQIGYLLLNSVFLVRETGSSAREKNGKMLKKCQRKPIFGRENFRQFTPVKSKIVRRKKQQNYTHEILKVPVTNFVGFNGPFINDVIGKIEVPPTQILLFTLFVTFADPPPPPHNPTSLFWFPKYLQQIWQI